MTINNIIFDLGGVLLNIDYQATIKAFKHLGITNFDEMYAQAAQDQIFDSFDKGQISAQVFRDELRRITGLPLTDESIDHAWNAMLLDLPWPRIDLLQGIKTHYRTFLLSNTNAIHIPVFHEYLRRQYGMDNLSAFFEKQYYSFEIGMHKPDREPFDLIIQENNLIPEETLFIDDSKQHLVGAQATGIKTFWLDTSSMQITDLFTWKYQLRPEVLETCC
jgi:glucose-1-phosphatase